jgi:y4mF family transcriptional regulator
MSQIGKVVRERRRELRLNQIELAALADVSPSFVRFVEHDKAGIRLDKLTAVLGVLGLELEVTRRTISQQPTPPFFPESAKRGLNRLNPHLDGSSDD